MPSPALIALAEAVLEVGRNPERILEIGCRGGDGTLFLAREYPAARVRGLDPSAESVRRAVARIGLDPEGRVAFKQGTARSLPYPDAHFDLVVVQGGKARPRELARVLRPGGELIVVGLPGSLLAWRLRRRGFEPVLARAAQDVGYLVARLG